MRDKLSVLFPLKEHPIHGITGLQATEKYDDNGYVKESGVLIIYFIPIKYRQKERFLL